MRATLLLILVFSACTSSDSKKNVMDYAVARVALKAALASGADAKVSDIYQQAVNAYETGERYYKRGKYLRADREFNKARRLAEKAEELARVSGLSGDSSSKDEGDEFLP